MSAAIAPCIRQTDLLQKSGAGLRGRLPRESAREDGRSAASIPLPGLPPTLLSIQSKRLVGEAVGAVAPSGGEAAPTCGGGLLLPPRDGVAPPAPALLELMR